MIFAASYRGQPATKQMRAGRAAVRVFAAVLLLASKLFAQSDVSAAEADRARQLVAAGKLDEAIAAYRRLVDRSPENPILLLNLCIAEYTARRYSDALTHATAALRLAPDLPAARLFLGASQLELGDSSGAVASLRAATAANPGDRNARLLLGEALLNQGDARAALEQLQAAAEMVPSNPRAWYALARAHHALGQDDAAQRAGERLTALPPSLESHLYAGDIHKRAGRWRESAREYAEALRL